MGQQYPQMGFADLGSRLFVPGDSSSHAMAMRCRTRHGRTEGRKDGRT